jgi:N-methylhydantoinase B
VNALAEQAAQVDPITAEVFRYALTAIPGQIDANIMRTAYSPLIYEYKDYAVGIVDHRGRLLSQSQGALPIFVANALGVAVGDGLAMYGAQGFAPGDVLLTNHAGTLGQHLNNVAMYAPIFVGEDNSELFGFMAIVAHWMDVGGSGQGGPLATDIFQEGVQYRGLKIWRGGVPDPAVYRTIESNTRFPRELLGDLEAQLAGCVRGAALAKGVVEKYGLATARASITLMWDAAEAASRAAIRLIPDGEYRSESWLDDDGTGKPFKVAATVKISGDAMEIDLSDCADEVSGPFNSGREGGAVAAARIAFKYLVDPHEPANEGAFRPLKVTIRDGTFMSAGPTAPMNYYSLPLPTVVDTIQKALAAALPQRVAAGHHGAFGVHIFVGKDPDTGELFQNLDTALGGWGATADRDGGGPFKSMVHGDTLDVPVEAQEVLYPLTIEAYELREDSGGAGRFRGGAGVKKVFRARAPCRVAVAQDRRRTPPWGLFGGLAGASPETLLVRSGQAPLRVNNEVVALNAGDRLEVYSGGGGGFGNPAERDPKALELDLKAGYVSQQAARELYGRQGDEH